MNRPRIGVTTSLNLTDSGAREQRLDLAYVRAVERAGGLPLIVPMVATDEAAEAFAALLDGLVVTGGPAVTDGLIGALPEDIDPTDPDRVASDRRILRAFLDARRPTLGICYGMQLASALAGGTIYAEGEIGVVLTWAIVPSDADRRDQWSADTLRISARGSFRFDAR